MWSSNFILAYTAIFLELPENKNPNTKLFRISSPRKLQAPQNLSTTKTLTTIAGSSNDDHSGHRRFDNSVKDHKAVTGDLTTQSKITKRSPEIRRLNRRSQSGHRRFDDSIVDHKQRLQQSPEIQRHNDYHKQTQFDNLGISLHLFIYYYFLYLESASVL